jgi:hypothetical protein
MKLTRYLLIGTVAAVLAGCATYPAVTTYPVTPATPVVYSTPVTYTDTYYHPSGYYNAGYNNGWNGYGGGCNYLGVNTYDCGYVPPVTVY